MAELARTIKGKMVLSVNDIPAMREVFSGLAIRSVDIEYTVGVAPNRKKASELIITKF